MQGQPQNQIQLPIKTILRYIQEKWYIFLISGIVALGIAYLNIKKSESIYQLNASLLLEDKSSAAARNDKFMKEMGILGTAGALEDEIGIITSFSLISKTVQELDAGISYYQKDLYPKRISKRIFPYLIEIDSTHPQVGDTRLLIQISEDGRLTLSGEVEKGFLFDPKTQEVITPLEDVEIEIEGKLGSPIVDKFFAGTIRKNPEAIEEAKDHMFAIRSISSLTENFKKNLTVEPVGDESNILQLAYKGAVIDEGIKFLDILMETYITEDIDKKNRKGQDALEFIEEQITGTTSSLKEVENTLESSGQVIDVQAAARLLADERSALEENLTERKMAVNSYQYIADKLRTSPANSEVLAPASLDKQDPVLSNLLIELSTLQRDKAKASISAVANSPQLQLYDAQIKSQRNAVIEHINNNLANAKNALADVRVRISRVEVKIDRLPAQQKKMAMIQRNLNKSEKQDTYLREKQAEVGMALASNKSESYVLDQARLASPDPISPKKSFIILFSLALGLGLPMLVLIGYELFNDKILSRHDLELSTDIPVLGIIIKSDQWNKVVSPETSHTRLAESFRSARVQLQYLLSKAEDTPNKIIGVTSSSPNEGKSFCAANFASTLALSGKKTVILDLDLRKPDQKEYFTYDNTIGLYGYLTGRHRYTDILTKIENINNLWLFPSGPSSHNSLDLLDSKKFKTLIKNLSKRFDHIILDTPPIGHTSDYYIIKDLVDFTIYVVRHNLTSSQALGRVNQLHEENTLGNMGILINGVKDVGGYNYGEGASYGYGKNSYGYSSQNTAQPKGLKEKIFSQLKK